ncbi:MAG: hypothetical protein IAG13_23085 [Deltaproteobacteria bacterium]|nr:hypothetical protein [Nannocystaceae bacterium]
MRPVRQRLRALVLCVAVQGVGCFDPEEVTSGGADTTGDGSSSDSIDPTLDSTSPTASSTVDPTDATETVDESSSSGTPPECVEDDDCAEQAGECEVASCPENTCVIEPREAGASCGDAADTECDGADSCDGKGACVVNIAQDGAPCTDCPLGLCGCAAGVCGDCTPAPSNNFITARSILAWELTGGWALYREAPQSESGPAIRFAGQVLGTDGNRSQPYPGGELETSYARSGPTLLPATLELLSWHVDEGGVGEFDRKSISISIDDGLTWQLVADCSLIPGLPFCPGVTDRAADAWDAVAIPVPIELQGMIGRIELGYSTGDDCCQGERGWYVDVTNFGSECSCTGDEACALGSGECGEAVCGAVGECELEAVAAGMACGDDESGQCTAADSCDGVGYCDAYDQPTGLTSCTDCPSGAGACQSCQQGACNDCATLVDPVGFDNGAALAGWVSESPGGTGNDWRLYSEAPPNANAGSLPIVFASTVFGTDGNRVAPYDVLVAPFNRQVEASQTTTAIDTIPASITFDSWHVDEGNNVDTKTIQVSVDDGATWNVLVDCNNGGDQALYPFCVSRLDERPADAWDAISVDTGGFAGQIGRLRFTYSTGDDCCGSERGWYLDNLSFASYCLDPLFP